MKDRNCSSLMRCASSLQRLFFLALLSIIAIGAYAQGKTVSGTVLDKSGESVIGASVVVKGTTNGTITDFDGKFTLSNVPNNASLEISFVGYKTQVIPVQGKNTFNVTMVEDTEVLDEVVVVGYGVAKKSDVTGAMVNVGAEALTERPVSNAFEALQGKAAGVDITTSERPGTVGDIRIRGARSLTASSDPLYVVDGVPLLSGAAIETLNPRDIESIDILKDASATAIYGSRGANGVIIVTTKQGKEGRFSLNYSGTVTISNIVDKSPSMSAADYVEYRRWAAYNADPSKYASPYQPTKENDAQLFADDPYALANINKGWVNGSWNPALVGNTDWTDFVTQTGIAHEHTISASGGTEKVNAYASFGYLDNQGTQQGQWYKRYTAKMSVNINPTKWFQLSANINASWSEQDYGMSTLKGQSSSVPDAIYGAAKAIYNYAVPYDDNGELIMQPGGGIQNTVIGETEKSTQQSQTMRALANFSATLDFGEMWSPLKGLRYKLNFGPDFRPGEKVHTLMQHQPIVELVPTAGHVCKMHVICHGHWII